MKVRLYLSKQGYDSKPNESAGIIKTINSYELVDIELEDLYNKLTNGHFIHHECGYSKSNTGGKKLTFKKAFLEQAQIMQIDFDYKFKDTKPNGKVIYKHYEPNEMPEWNAELLSNLKYTTNNGYEVDISPTFWMESFSAHKVTEKKEVGNSIHMFYAFYDPIYSVSDYEKVAVVIIYAVYKALQANGYEIPLEKNRCPFDPVSKDMFQGMWGSYNQKCHFNGNLYFWDELINSYTHEIKDKIFQVDLDEIQEASEEDIKRTISAYSTVKSIDDIDINKSQYLKYKEYFGHTEGFHIISVLKHEYSKIEENINSTQSLCYQVCKKLLFGHCNDYFDCPESTFIRDYKRCKAYKKKGGTDAAYLSHVIKLIGDTGAIPLIEYKEQDIKTNNNNIIKLNKTEYLSDKKDEILKCFDKSKINMIIAQPGLGKTVFAKSLEGRTLIIELFNSIINSEDKFSSIEFNKFIESNYINPNSSSCHNDLVQNHCSVASANKFVSWYDNVIKDESYNQFNKDNIPYELYNSGDVLFNNVILDESHLLCLSNYRYDVMGDTVKYLKELKRNYPDTKIIIMTGTPFGEDIIFDNLNKIYIEAEQRYHKVFKMIQTTSIEGFMKELVKDSIAKGLRVFIPVDSENWFDTFIESCIEDGIITKDVCYYFNQPKNEEEIEVNILNTKLIGDIKVLGTSSYMSVGIDLEDWKTEFVTIVPTGASNSGNFSGIEVEQFANRHRKQNLTVYYVISKNENNCKKPVLSSSCRALLNIKNDLIKSMYRTVPIVIKIPNYLIPNKSNELEVNEDRFNVFVYYKDMKPIISHPTIIYEYMQKIGWECEWKTVENTHRGIDTKEHRDEVKAEGVQEFMSVLNVWSEYFYPIIKVKDTIQEKLEIIPHKSDGNMFDADYIEVGFTNYYAKNVLLNKLLSIREYLTGLGAYKLINDAYDGNKINMTFIDRNIHAIKIIHTYVKTGIWKDISDKLGDFYSKYSTVDTGVHKDNKKQFEDERNRIVQEIWDELSNRIDDDTLKLAFNSNYNGVTENIISDFMEGIKLVCTMYLNKETKVKKINKKSVKVTMYSWTNSKLLKYEVRKDKTISF